MDAHERAERLAEAAARRAGKGTRRNPTPTAQDVANLASDIEHQLLLDDPDTAPSKAKPDHWR